MDAHQIPTERDLYVYGAGGHGIVVAEAAEQAGWQVKGFLDDKPSTTLVGKWCFIGALPQDTAGKNVTVAIGDNMARRRLSADLAQTGLNLVNIIHPSACVSKSAILGRGLFVGPHAVINGQANIEDGVVINTAAIVEHHCVIRGYSHIGPRAVLCGHVTVGSMVTVGAGATVIPQVTIGDDSIVGAGAVVVNEVLKSQTVMGVPAKIKPIDIRIAQ